MKKIFIVLLIWLSPISGNSQINPQRQTPLAFTHVTILDMRGGPVKLDMTVTILGNHISSVGNSKTAKLPKGTQVVDATGKYLIPGLWDMHVHALRPQGINTDNFLSLFIANGITGVREMGNSGLSMAQVRHLRTQIEAREQPGHRLYVSGPLLDGRLSGWKSKVVVTTKQARRTAVDSLKKAGADFIKVYSWLSPASYFAIADEAQKQGIPFVGHVPESVTAAEASNAGQKSFEHLYEILLACSTNEWQLRQERLDLSALQPGTPEWQEKWNIYTQLLLNTYNEKKAQELFFLFVKKSTWQCPTLTERYASANFIESSQAHPERLKYLPAAMKEFWLERTDFRKKTATPTRLELLRKQYQKELLLVGAMNKAGVPLLVGTDDGNPYVFPGFSLHDELDLLVKAGLSPLEALQAATLNPAKYFGLTNSLGTVEEGKLADLLLLEANPIENISNTKKISAVVANGRYFSKEALAQLLKHAKAVASGK